MCVYNIKSSDQGPILGPRWSYSKILHLIMSANKAIVFVSLGALTKCHRLMDYKQQWFIFHGSGG